MLSAIDASVAASLPRCASPPPCLSHPEEERGTRGRRRAVLLPRTSQHRRKRCAPRRNRRLVLVLDPGGGGGDDDDFARRRGMIGKSCYAGAPRRRMLLHQHCRRLECRRSLGFRLGHSLPTTQSLTLLSSIAQTQTTRRRYQHHPPSPGALALELL